MERRKQNLGDADPRASQEARANRVKSLRQMTRLSRRAFSEKFGVPPSTLQNWEDVGANGLTEKGAIKLVRVLKTAGIFSTLEWLLYGAGEGPKVSEQLFLNTPAFESLSDEPRDDENALLVEELLLFRQHYKQQVFDYVVPDDGMLPRFIKGEHVAGLRHLENFSKVVGDDCIVQTETGDILVRHVKKGSVEGCYTLTCLNPQTSVSKPILYDVKLTLAAPIIWSRRKYSYKN